MDSPLREAPNLIVTPHLYSRTSIRILRREAAAEVARVSRRSAELALRAGVARP